MDANQIFDFLRNLKDNNNRDWFQANKKSYDKAKSDFEHFAATVITRISAIDAQLQSPAVKDCMFRIFRDVRFSHDKAPYKVNFGAFIAKGGRKSYYPGYYFHFEPEQSMIAAGVYMPPPDILKALRNEIYYNSHEFAAILADQNLSKYFSGLGDFDKLKKAPKDFPADFAGIELLKYKSYIVSKQFSDNEISADTFEPTAIEIVKSLQPFMAFLNRAIANI